MCIINKIVFLNLCCVNNSMTSAQLRMARAALRWTIRVLAANSGVHANTIAACEADKTSPHGPTMAALERALADGLRTQGLRFTDAGGIEPIPDDQA